MNQQNQNPNQTSSSRTTRSQVSRVSSSRAAASRSQASSPGRPGRPAEARSAAAGRPEGGQQRQKPLKRSQSLRMIKRSPAGKAGFSLVHVVVQRRMFIAAPHSPSPAAGLCLRHGHYALPLFHLYGDPPDDQAFDFIHVETIVSRSSMHDWTIRAHRHRNLFQILLIERGGGEMTYEAASLPFEAPAAILVPPTTAHGFRFPRERDRRLGGELHRGRGGGARRTLGRGAGAAQGAGRRAGRAARPTRPRSSGSSALCAESTRRAFSRAKAIGWRCAGCSR